MDPQAVVSSRVCSADLFAAMGQVTVAHPPAAMFEELDALLDTLQRECSRLPGPWKREHRSFKLQRQQPRQQQQQQQKLQRRRRQKQRQQQQQLQLQEQQQRKISCGKPFLRHQNTSSLKNKALCDVTNTVSCVVGRSQTTQSTRTARAEKVRASFPPPDTKTAAEPHLQSHAVHSLDLAAAVEVDDEDVRQQQHEKLLELGPDKVNNGDVPPILWVYNPLYRSPEEETDDSSCGVRQALTSHPHDENAEEEEKEEEMEEEQKEGQQKESAETSTEGELEPDTLGWVHNPLYVPFKPGRQ